MKRFPFSLAVKILLLLQVPVLIFHLLVITGIIPYNIVWGGRLHSTDEMRKFETMSILLNIFMASVIGIKGNYIKISIHPLIIYTILWCFAILFTLNTVGNLLAKVTLETVVFTPLTFLSAVLCGRLALEKETQ
jgi:hypothetical protein